MKVLKKNFKIILLCMVISAGIFLALALTRPGYAGMMNDGSFRTWGGTWLSQYEGHVVKVTFVNVPTYLGTDLGKTSALQILEVGQAGIVVTFRPSRTVFLPYSQIAAIEPIYQNTWN